MSKSKGFTLIELVVVIVILALLAAIALPRFSNLTQQARLVAVRGLEGGLRGAAALAHAQALVEGKTTQASGQTVLMEGVAVALEYGYPADGSTTTGIVQALYDASANYAITLAGQTVQFRLRDAQGNAIANCGVDYTAPTAVNTSPTIAAVTTGC
jgi:MSHA pilin protein MshA